MKVSLIALLLFTLFLSFSSISYADAVFDCTHPKMTANSNSVVPERLVERDNVRVEIWKDDAGDNNVFVFSGTGYDYELDIAAFVDDCRLNGETPQNILDESYFSKELSEDDMGICLSYNMDGINDVILYLNGATAAYTRCRKY